MWICPSCGATIFGEGYCPNMACASRAGEITTGGTCPHIRRITDTAGERCADCGAEIPINIPSVWLEPWIKPRIKPRIKPPYSFDSFTVSLGREGPDAVWVQ